MSNATTQWQYLFKLAQSQLLPTLFDLLEVNYSIIDTEGNYITQNQAAFTNISKGLCRAEKIDQATWEHCQQVMQSKNKVIHEECLQGRYYLSIKQPLIEHECCIGIMVISIDITERKQAERMKAEFLRNMNHDVRTPLTGMLGIARLLYSEEANPDKKLYLADLINSAERLSALLQQILELSYRDVNSPFIERCAFNIRDVLQEVSALMAAALTLKGLALHIDCQDKVVNTDPFRLTKLLINLISNAIKFTEKGYIHVRVVTEPKLTISVEDTGIGIPPDQLKAIFNPFTKLKPSGESQIFMGSGIGLYLAKQCAHELGGDIFVESEMGKGSTFTFAEL